MTLLLHAIVPSEDVAVPAPLLAVPIGRLIGIASEDDADMHEHHRRVMLLHDEFSACVPARYGSRFADTASLHAALAERQARLYEAIERVRGRSELAVTVLWIESPATPEGGPGTRYLKDRQARQQIAQRVADDVERAAAAIETRRALNPRPDIAASMALLVERSSEASVARRVNDLDLADGVRILVSGPWAPYSFVGHDQRER